MDISEDIRSSRLSGTEIRSLVDWPVRLIEDYLNVLDNLSLLSVNLDETNVSVANLEGESSSLENRVALAEIDIISLQMRMTQAEAAISSLQAAIPIILASLSSLDQRVTALEQRMTSLEARVTALENAP